MLEMVYQVLKWKGREKKKRKRLQRCEIYIGGVCMYCMSAVRFVGTI